MATRIPQIISVDDHVVEPPDLWQRWLPASLRDRGPKVVQGGFDMTSADGGYLTTMTSTRPFVDWWVYEDAAVIMPQVSYCAGLIPPEERGYAPVNFSDMPPAFTDPHARLQAMSTNHTERSMCFPNMFSRFCGQRFLAAKDRALALACVRAYNDWMVEEWCGDSGGRLIPLCIVPLWDPLMAADELRRNAARGCKALAFTELPVNLGLPSIHDPARHWDPLFQACNETGTVICMHIGSGSKMPTSSSDAPQGVQIALTTNNAQFSLADWLLSGVLARYPDLKIAYSESQIGWMPFLFERLDNIFRKSKVWADMHPAITELPSSYVPGRVYGCFFEDDFGIESRYAVGVDQITFETDYPHQDSLWPNSLDYLERILADVPDDEVEKIVRGNAISMLNLPSTLSRGISDESIPAVTQPNVPLSKIGA